MGTPLLMKHVLGVLAADLEDRVDVLLEVGRADGVGDDLVVDADRLEEDAEELARGSRGRHEADPRLVLAQLLPDLAQAELERGDRIAVRAAVVLGDDLERPGVDQRDLGRGGAAVDAEHVLGLGIVGAPPRRRMMHQLARTRRAAQKVLKMSAEPGRTSVAFRAAWRPGFGPGALRRRPRSRAPRSGTTKSISGLLSADEVDQVAVARDAADRARPDRSTSFALVRNSATLSAITLLSDSAMSPLLASPLFSRCVQSDFMNTEQRAERRWTLGAVADLVDVLEPQVHAAELLAEELAGARRALVAGVGVDDAAAAVEDVDHQVLAAHRHDGAGLELEGIEAALDGHRGDDLGQRDAMAPFGPRDHATQRRGSLRGCPGGASASRGDRPRGGVSRARRRRLLREQAELQGGGSDIDSECLFSHSSVSPQGTGGRGLPCPRNLTPCRDEYITACSHPPSRRYQIILNLCQTRDSSRASTHARTRFRPRIRSRPARPWRSVAETG